MHNGLYARTVNEWKFIVFWRKVLKHFLSVLFPPRLFWSACADANILTLLPSAKQCSMHATSKKEHPSLENLDRELDCKWVFLPFSPFWGSIFQKAEKNRYLENLDSMLKQEEIQEIRKGWQPWVFNGEHMLSHSWSWDRLTHSVPQNEALVPCGCAHTARGMRPLFRRLYCCCLGKIQPKWNWYQHELTSDEGRDSITFYCVVLTFKSAKIRWIYTFHGRWQRA